MDLKDRLCPDTWGEHTSQNELSKSIASNHLSFTDFNTQQHQQKWEDRSVLNFDTGMKLPLPELNQSSETRSSLPCNLIPQMNDTNMSNRTRDWDPMAMLNDLSFLEQKVHQLQDLVHLIVGRKDQVFGRPEELLAQQQQQLVTADLTSIVIQLISAAGSLLPSVKQNLSTITPVGQLQQVLFPSEAGFSGGVYPNNGGTQVSDHINWMDALCISGAEQNCITEEHEMKDEEDVDEGENLPPGSYEILQLEKEEILAPHTHFCTICGKGFKRDANLRMHMRGHGDEYKTAVALAKPNKEQNSQPDLVKRYSCPYAGCKRNKEHKKFQPLKTILCVKNHYKRSHCDKRYICSRCHTKKFSVIADLKTHEKHCGKDKWLCSCGTTFSRKGKLFGHIALFQGHTPAIPPDETKVSAGTSQAANKVGSFTFNFSSDVPSGSGIQNIGDVKGSIDDPASCFSPLNMDMCNFGGFHEFPRPTLDDPESAFSFLIPGSCNYNQKTEVTGSCVLGSVGS